MMKTSDRLLLVGAWALILSTVAMVALVASLVVPGWVRTLAYERPASVSAETEAYAQRLADEVVGESVTIRFDADTECDDALACVMVKDPKVIHLPTLDLGSAGLFAAVVIHEAVHSYVVLHDIDASAFENLEPGLPASEAIADCAARALSENMTPYFRCPESWQQRVLDAIGIKQYVITYLDGEARLGVWR